MVAGSTMNADGTKKCRKQRPRTFHINVERAANKLTTLAKLRTCRFQWDASDYDKPKRSFGPCKAALANAAEMLAVLIYEAPNGYPSLQTVRNLLMKLDTDDGVLGCNDQNLG